LALTGFLHDDHTGFMVPGGVHPESRPIGGDDEALMLATVQELMMELHPSASPMSFGLDSLLDADWGLDSLALVELRARVEEVFGVTLPDPVLGMPTLAGWLQEVRSGRGSDRSAEPRVVVPRATRVPVEAGAGWPVDAATLLDALAWHA